MMNRRQLVTRTLFGLSGGSLSLSLLAEEPWTQVEFVATAALAERINAGKAPEIICVAFPFLYRQRHIRGAKFAGPTNKPEGVQDLERLAATLSKDSEVVIYCGCCPLKDCPNIRPAFATLKRIGFKTVRVLNIPNNLHNDWTTKGFPAEPPQAPRIVGA